MLTDMITYFADSERRVGMIRPDGSNECYPDFGLPEQSALRLGRVYPGGKQVEVLNLKDSKYWRYDFITKTTEEISIATHDILPGGTRYLHNENIDWVFTIYISDEDGGNREDIYTSPGYGYSLSLSPDGKRLTFHMTGTPGRNAYEIYVQDLESRELQLIVSDPDYINFGPDWSKDGEWLLYQRCAHLEDPAHDRSDICISRSDGSEHRLLTTGQSCWFSAPTGTPERHRGGSNWPLWSPDCSKIVCVMLLPGSRGAWKWAADRPDTDHFNRDYCPDQACGGTRICVIDVKTGEITPVTHDATPTWNTRAAWSPDGKMISFVRADVGCLPELWVVDADGSNKRFLTHGYRGTGVDYPVWKQFAAEALA